MAASYAAQVLVWLDQRILPRKSLMKPPVMEVTTTPPMPAPNARAATSLARSWTDWATAEANEPYGMLTSK